MFRKLLTLLIFVNRICLRMFFPGAFFNFKLKHSKVLKYSSNFIQEQIAWKSEILERTRTFIKDPPSVIGAHYLSLQAAEGKWLAKINVVVVIYLQLQMKMWKRIFCAKIDNWQNLSFSSYPSFQKLELIIGHQMFKVPDLPTVRQLYCFLKPCSDYSNSAATSH